MLSNKDAHNVLFLNLIEMYSEEQVSHGEQFRKRREKFVIFVKHEDRIMFKHN